MRLLQSLVKLIDLDGELFSTFDLLDGAGIDEGCQRLDVCRDLFEASLAGLLRLLLVKAQLLQHAIDVLLPQQILLTGRLSFIEPSVLLLDGDLNHG